MKNLQNKGKEKTLHFKNFARMKVRELGIDGAVQYFRQQKLYYKNNLLYEKSWLYISIAEMSLDYIVNELGE